MVKTKYALKKYMGHGTIVYRTAIDRWLLPRILPRGYMYFTLTFDPVNWFKVTLQPPSTDIVWVKLQPNTVIVKGNMVHTNGTSEGRSNIIRHTNSGVLAIELLHSLRWLTTP